MYTFTDRERPLADAAARGHRADRRAYVEHGLHREPQPVKAYTIAPMYRYGAPGRAATASTGSCSVEAIGSADPARRRRGDPALRTSCSRASGVTQFELQLNSIGDAACRPAYVEQLTAWLDAHPDVLDDEARHKRATSPLQVFDVKNPARPRGARRCAEDRRVALRRVPRRTSTTCAGTSTRYGVPYTLEPTLVRGLDYYTRTTFEFVGPDENANSTICGGGRYDGLVEAVGGPPTPGIGFGAGHRAAAARARERGRSPPSRRRSTCSSSLDAARRATGCSQMLAELRRAGLAPTPTTPAARSRASSRRPAGRGARTVVIVARPTRRCAPAGPSRSVALDELAATLTPMSGWRDRPRQRAAPGRRGAHGHRSPAGSRAGATSAGSIFVDLRDEGGVVQLVINPEHAPPRPRSRTSCATSSSIRARGDGRPARARDGRTRASRPARSRCRSSELEILSPLDAAAVPARRGGRRRDAAHPLPLARPAPRAAAAEHPHPRQGSSRSSGSEMEADGLRRHRDADHGQADARGRARLPRPDAPAAGALLRAAAEPADLQAAARDRRLRALLPDRALLPGRGSARRPRSRS